MGAVLLWWLVLSAMGWLAWPLAAAIFRHLPDRGYACARCLGLLLYSYLYWLLGITGLTPNATAFAWGLAALLVLASGAVWRRQRADLSACMRREWRHILTVEILFAAALFLYAAHKAHDPAINHTEEPMDFAFLNGILRSPRLPPNDPWMAGESISYYYFGYLTVALLTRLTALPSSIGYNLGLAHTWALAMIGWYGVLAALLSPHEESVAPRRAAPGWALLGAAAIGLAGNLESVLELLWARGWVGEALVRWCGIPGLAEAASGGRWLPDGDWWWWRASRVIADYNFLGRTPTVITEFPSFSLILGDLHPHVMALPYGALTLALAVELYHRERTGLAQRWQRDASAWVMPLIIGALGFVNSWDLPTFGGVCLLALGLGAWQGAHGHMKPQWARIASWAVMLVIGSILLYLPFYITLKSQARGIGLAYYAKTPLKHYVLCLGLWLTPIVGDTTRLFIILRRERRCLATRRAVWVIWGVIALAPWVILAIWGRWGRLLLGLGVLAINGPWLLLLLSVLLTLVTVNMIALIGARDDRADVTLILAQGLALIGLGLTYITEFVYLRDLFDARMNTMFKIYYQAWVLLGIAAALAAWRLWRGGKWTRAMVLCAGTILVAALYYPFAAAHAKASGYRAKPTLDGAAYLRSEAPDAYGVYHWLEVNARPGEVLVEGVGEEYRADSNRLSAWTGVPTILGWPGHETQWRGDNKDVMRRTADVATIYTSSNAQLVLATLHQYRAAYLYVGPYESEHYAFDKSRLDWYASFLEPIYAQGDERLYRVPQTD